jgi:transcription termination factor NusB
MALMILVATSLTSHIDKEDLELLDRMARAGLRAMLLELGYEADQPQAPEEAGGSV